MGIFKRMISAELEIYAGCRESSGELHLGPRRVRACRAGSHRKKHHSFLRSAPVSFC